MVKKLISINLVVLSILLFSCTSKVEKVMSNITEKKIDEALEDYKTLEDSRKDEVNDTIKKLIDEQYQLFIDKKSSSIDSMAEIMKLKKFDGISEYATEINEKINKINNSREGFEKGKEFEKTENVDIAMEGYKAVIELDIENYEIAQKKISELQVVLDEKNKKELEKQIAENNKYVINSVSIVSSQLGNDDGVQVLVQNNADTPVKEFSVGVFIYDKNGLPMKTSILAGGEIYLGAKDTNANIMPGEVYGADRVIETYLDRGTVGYAKACLIEVTDYNGKKWTNSAYSQWYSDNYDKKY